MSVYITFTKLHIENQLQEQEASKVFQISIRNDNYKQEIKFKRNNDHIMERPDKIPYNILILPQYEKIDIKVFELTIDNDNQIVSTNLIGMRTINEWKMQADRNQKAYLKKCVIREGSWSFEFEYKVKYEKRAIFSGHFMNILNQQLDDNQTNQSTEVNEPKIMTTKQFPNRNTIQIDRNTNEEEDEDENDKDEIFDQTNHIEDLPKYFHTKNMPSSLISTDINGEKICNCSHGNHINGHSTRQFLCPEHNLIQIKQEVEDMETPTFKKKSRSKSGASQRVYFYKGSCKSKNFFSCLDIPVEEEQICIIEPHYTSSQRRFS